MKDQTLCNNLRKSLLREIAALRRAIEARSESVPYAESILHILADTEFELTRDPCQTTRLRQHAYGIFRLVTDSSDLEQGSVGKGLIQFHTRLREFVHTVEGGGPAA
jgi:hypothetical protein